MQNQSYNTFPQIIKDTVNILENLLLKFFRIPLKIYILTYKLPKVLLWKIDGNQSHF